MSAPTVLAAISATAVSACLWTSGATRPLFSHDLHASVNKLECTLCHAGAETADRAGMPTMASCLPCHGHESDSEADATATIPRFFDADYLARVESTATARREVRFSHRVHVQTHGLACSDCHGGAGSGASVGDEARVSMDDCIGCHARHGKTNACRDCHTEIDRDRAPASHARAWIERHGTEVRFGEPSTANQCALCHDQASGCFACHAQQPPRDHTNYWRLRGHGVAAHIDRQRCSTCHLRDSCESCHQDTRPLSHAAGFGGRASRHCTRCHLPLAAADGCGTCHRATPGHDAATPMPSWHVPAMNCRACHGAGVRLPHPDGGHVCTSCHR